MEDARAGRGVGERKKGRRGQTAQGSDVLGWGRGGASGPGVCVELGNWLPSWQVLRTPGAPGARVPDAQLFNKWPLAWSQGSQLLEGLAESKFIF